MFYFTYLSILSVYYFLFYYFCILFYFFILFIVLFLSLFILFYLFIYLLFLCLWGRECPCVNAAYILLYFKRVWVCRDLHLYILNMDCSHRARSPGTFILWPLICDIPGEQRYNCCDDIPPRPANRGGIIIVTRPGWGACPPAFSCSAHAGGACVPRNENIYLARGLADYFVIPQRGNVPLGKFFDK